MEIVPEILKSIASLLWPLIVIIILLAFRKQVSDLIETARSRKFTVKVGEMELSMEEYNKQQGELIKDLQNQVAALQKVQGQSSDHKTASPAFAPGSSSPIHPSTRSVLWVDDHPRNNAMLIQNLQDAGIMVTTATSTREATGLFRAKTFDKVVTDLSRKENEHVNPMAGLDLVKSLREMNDDVPIYIYTSTDKAEKMFDAAQEAGANQITGSATILMALLKA
jgi:CheY-like chemotaxis protein